MSTEFNPVPIDPNRYTETLKAAIDEADRGELVRLPIEFLDDDYTHSTDTDAEPTEDKDAANLFLAGERSTATREELLGFLGLEAGNDQGTEVEK